MMGKSEIHDFFRFGQNTTANATQGKNTPFLDRPLDASTNPDYNATGFGGGAHRMMLAEYNFTDPGVYAEDENADWALSKGNPDLNGNGVGEGFATVRVADRADMDTCSRGAGLIHVYSLWSKVHMLRKSSIGSHSWRRELTDTILPVSIMLLLLLQKSQMQGIKFSDFNKSVLTNFDMTLITIEYRVKDHWDNASIIATRLVYFYESRQFGNHAFYATPLTDAGGKPFEDFDNNGTAGTNPSLSGARKDHDGDGVSDFGNLPWVLILKMPTILLIWPILLRSGNLLTLM